MVVFEGLAHHIVAHGNPLCGPVVAQRGAAVKDGGHAQPLQSLGVTQQAEVVQVAVLIGQKIVHHQHLVQSGYYVIHTQGLTAGDEVLIHRLAVALFLCLHHLPGGDQLGVRGDKIGTHRVGLAVAPEQTVWNVGDVQTL